MSAPKEASVPEDTDAMKMIDDSNEVPKSSVIEVTVSEEVLGLPKWVRLMVLTIGCCIVFYGIILIWWFHNKDHNSHTAWHKFTDAVMFGTYIFTTVGYGGPTSEFDIYEHDLHMALVSLYAIGAITIMATLIGEVVEQAIIGAAIKNLERSDGDEHDDSCWAEWSVWFYSVLLCVVIILFACPFFVYLFEFPDMGTRLLDPSDPKTGISIPAKLTWMQAVYFCIISMTTIGLGDIMPPRAGWGLVFTSIWMIVGIAAMGNVTVRTAEKIRSALGFGQIDALVQKTRDIKNAFLSVHNEDYTRNMVEKMTPKQRAEGINKHEFTVSILLEHRVVDQKIIDAIFAVFKDIDVNDDKVISRQDLLHYQTRPQPQELDLLEAMDDGAA